MGPSHPPRRVSLLTTGLARGGAETQVLLLAKGLQQRGWKVSVESLLPPQAFADELEQNGIPVVSLGMRPGVPNPAAIYRLARRWRTFRPHIVHSHMVHANLLGRIARIFAPAPVLIATAHSIWEGPKWRDWAYRFTDRLGDLTTNVSQAGLDRYVRHGLVRKDRAAWVPNGIDTARFAPDAELRRSLRRQMGWEEKFVWLAVGNLREPKDYPNLLSAFAAAHTGAPSMRLAIAGAGHLLDSLRAQAFHLRIENRVEFLGARTDVRELMQAADAFVMSSAWEGMPMALLEASASALPIVATRVGGNVEVVEHGRTGYLVPACDSSALAQAMATLALQTPAARRELGEAGRNRVRTLYDFQRVLDRWENIYAQLLQNKADLRLARRESLTTGRIALWRRN